MKYYCILSLFSPTAIRMIQMSSPLEGIIIQCHSRRTIQWRERERERERRPLGFTAKRSGESFALGINDHTKDASKSNQGHREERKEKREEKTERTVRERTSRPNPS